MTDHTTAPTATAGGAKPAHSTTKNVVELAIADGRFKTLAAALTAAGLVETLAGAGPFTVFAPTDAAFEKLPAGTVDGLLKDVPTLTGILKFHVVAGRVMSADLAKSAGTNGKASTKTLQGGELALHVAGTAVHLGADQKTSVTQADVRASNGVIHIIDTVQMPSA
ncbi:MAG: fasciclin domain-containing protein [Gemmatimonadales bacterium]|nr:fasciclin domain-containing protein [Gemmatimonadales bacterium]